MSKEDVIELYEKYKSPKRIGKVFNTSQQTITRLMDFYEIPRYKGNIGNKKHFFNEKYFDTIDTEEKAYWLGFIYADGCVYKGTGKTMRLQINLKQADKYQLKKFQKAIGSDYKIQDKEVNGYPASLLKINSTIMCKDLQKHGVSFRKSLLCKMPELKKDLVNHFIRGYFDGDGAIFLKISNRIHYGFNICGGIDMIKEISSILGIKYIPKKDSDTIFVTYANGKEKLIEIYNYLYNNSTIYMKRKKRVYDILVYVLNSPFME